MATVSERFARAVIAGNGFHPSCPEDGAPDNPACVKVVEYGNAWGDKSYGLVFEKDRAPFRYEHPTFHVRNPKVIWTRTNLD